MDFSNVVKESEEVEGAEAGPEPPIWAQVRTPSHSLPPVAKRVASVGLGGLGGLGDEILHEPKEAHHSGTGPPRSQEESGDIGEGVRGVCPSSGAGESGEAHRAWPQYQKLPHAGSCHRVGPHLPLVRGRQVLIMGNRDSIDDMSGGNAEILTTVLKLIDRYDLYGQVSYPKHHKQSEVPHIYRLAAKSKVGALFRFSRLPPTLTHTSVWLRWSAGGVRESGSGGTLWVDTHRGE